MMQSVLMSCKSNRGKGIFPTLIRFKTNWFAVDCWKCQIFSLWLSFDICGGTGVSLFFHWYCCWFLFVLQNGIFFLCSVILYSKWPVKQLPMIEYKYQGIWELCFKYPTAIFCKGDSPKSQRFKTLIMLFLVRPVAITPWLHVLISFSLFLQPVQYVYWTLQLPRFV